MKDLTDHEFLIWLSNRIKFKYKDNIMISQRLDKISQELVFQAKVLQDISDRDYSEIDRMLK